MLQSNNTTTAKRAECQGHKFLKIEIGSLQRTCNMVGFENIIKFTSRSGPESRKIIRKIEQDIKNENRRKHTALLLLHAIWICILNFEFRIFSFS